MLSTDKILSTVENMLDCLASKTSCHFRGVYIITLIKNQLGEKFTKCRRIKNSLCLLELLILSLFFQLDCHELLEAVLASAKYPPFVCSLIQLFVQLFPCQDFKKRKKKNNKC